MIAGIVLAAGLSSRLGRNKQLLPVHGEPLLRHTLRRVLTAHLDQVILIVGHEADAVRETAAGLPVTVIENSEYARGQSTSVRVGLAAFPPEIEAAVFILGDQPGIAGAVIDALIAAWRETGAPVVAPRYTDGIGNPVLFARRVFPEFAVLSGDTGAKPVVQIHQAAGDLLLVPVDTPAPRDVDTEGDVAVAIASIAPDA